MAYCKGCTSKAKCKEAGKCLKSGKKMAYGGAVKKKKMAVGGAALKTPPKDAKGLKKLPTPVRNKMGYMSKGGVAKKKAK